MSVITKDLGVATAYGYAKSKGYTGTEEEFAELMASYADVAQQAEASAQDAEDAKDAAITAKTAAQTAQTAAESAQTAAAGSAQTASTKASEASNSAQTAAGSATAAGDSATAAAGSAETAQTAAQTATTKASEASSSASAASTAKTGAETARTGAQTAQTAAETAQANAEAAASSVSASAAQIEQNTEDITGLKNDLNGEVESLNASVDAISAHSYCKNLVGQDTTIYYPVYIPANTPFTMSTADGQPVGATGVNLVGYDANKQDVTNYGWSFNQAFSSRTVSRNVDIYYLQWTKVIDGRPFQVEIGSVATDYQEYFANPDVLDRYILDCFKESITANKANVIIGDKHRVDINNRTVSWDRNMYIKTVNGTFTITNAEAYEQLTEYATYDTETRLITVTIPYECVLVYRISDSSLKVVTPQNVTPDDVVLFGEYYTNDYGLLWDKYWRDHYIDNYQTYTENGLSAVDIFNAEPYTGTYDWQTPVVNYGKLFNGKANVEAFAFFTDPHVLGFADDNRNETKMENFLKRVQKVYNSTPCSFLVCGGDWLNNSTTKAEACYRLGYLKGIAAHLLDGCKLVVGNHDTNYQGKLDSNSENFTGRLNDSTIAAILFRDTDTKKSYYSFDGANSKCYVLDTGIEHDTMLAYDWEQISWLASKLIEDDAEHAIIFLHIINDTNQTEPYVFASNCGNLVEAYNNHTTITLNSVVYDFTSCTGHVDFWVAGHNHTDSTGTLGGIPYFITATNSFGSDVPLIDLVLVDYDNRIVNLVRVGGTGTDRTISIA